LGPTESTTLVFKREDDGKIRVTSIKPQVVLRDEVLEVRNVEGRLHIDPRSTNPTNGTRRAVGPGDPNGDLRPALAGPVHHLRKTLTSFGVQLFGGGALVGR
jgi:hypothetical protein